MATDPGPSSVRQLEREDVQEDIPLVDDVPAGEQHVVVPAVVKMKLSSFCSSPRLRTHLNKLVLDMNRLLGEAYCFANLHVARLLASHPPEPLPMMDRNFFYRCLVAVSENNVRAGTLGPDIARTLELFDALRTDEVPKVDIRGRNQVVADLSITMATMATNHLWMNLKGRLDRYLKWRHPELTRRQRGRVICLVVSAPRQAVDPMASYAAIITELRSILPLQSRQQFASRAHLTLPLYHRMLTETEKKMPPRARLFSLLPNKNGFTLSYIPVSSMTLMAILKQLGMEPSIHGDGRDADHRAFWAKYFNLKAVETKDTRRFDERIMTDGCGVSILMAKHSCLTCPNKAPTVKLESGCARCGVDAGFDDVVTVAWADGTVKSYSSARYYEDAHYNTSRRRIDAWNSHTTGVVAEIPSALTTNMEQLQDHIQTYIQLLPGLLEHRAGCGYRNMRFLRYIGRQKAINAICDLIAPPDVPTVVGFGDWNGGHGTPISRRCAGPLQAVKLELARRPHVELHSIPEFRTSINCHCCHNKMSNMKAESAKVKRNGERVHQPRHKIHKVLHCKPSQGRAAPSGLPCCGHTWNRDVNAAKNMLMLVLLERKGWERPPAFRRDG
jgi:hypothetical protein